MMDKKAQGLSLNVIIIAALALIVLVVLAVIFMGKSASFDRGVTGETQTELIKMKISYGDCHPNERVEQSFVTELSQAEDVEAEAEAKSDFKGEIDNCKALSTDKSACENGGCAWE